MSKKKLAGIIAACVIAIIIVIVAINDGDSNGVGKTYHTLITDTSPSTAGSVSLSPSGGVYQSGAQVTLTANARGGYTFDHWSGDASGTSATIVITMDSNKDITAYFEGEPATVKARVTRVIDGDTIEVNLDGIAYKVRYIGIDTPETVHPSEPVECFGKEASNKNSELVQGKTERNIGQIKSIEKCKQYKANTIEELAESAGIDAKGLKENVGKYNSDIDSMGYDTVFGRKFQFGEMRPVVKIDIPPFSAIKCITSITSMKGGLKINGRSQVLNQYDEAIPGLYAAGEMTGGLHTKTYMLGVMTSSCMTFGIIAGRNAVKEPAWQ